MDKRYFRMIGRWFWLLILMPLVAAAATYLITSREAVLYETTTRLIVGPGIDNPSPDLNDLRAGAQLMQTYAELPQTRPFLTNIIAQLDLEMDPAELSKMIEVVTNEDAQILSVTVTGQDPRQIAGIANAVAAELVLASPSGGVTPAAQLKALIGSQATALEESVGQTEESIRALSESLEATTDPEARRDLLERLTTERARLADTHHTLALLYQNIQEATTNEMRVIEPAVEVTQVDSQALLKVIIAAAAGLGLSLTVVVAFEYLSNVVETAEELVQAGDAPVLGSVARYKLADSDNELVVRAQPHSQAAENLRAIGARLLFSDKYVKRLGSVLVVGVMNDDETGNIAANLAVILAQTGHRVLLIDANLHRPVAGRFFNTARDRGLTTALNDPQLRIQPEAIEWAPGLFVLPGGPVTLDVFGLLASSRMVQLLRDVEHEYDLVLLTAPPLPAYADSFFLGSQVDKVMVVARSGQTRRDILQKAVVNLRTVGAEILGLVLTHSFDAPGGDKPRFRLRRVKEGSRAARAALDADSMPEPAVPV